ncbi:MAG: PEGA domain-containing protein [Bacteroidota bacterium]
MQIQFGTRVNEIALIFKSGFLMTYNLITRSNYLLLTLVFFFILLVSCDQEVSVSPEEEIPPTGKLFINSTPSNYKIYVDGKNTGRVTPDSISWMEEREYSIVLKKRLWRDTSFVMSANEEKRVDTLIDYYKNPSMNGSVYFTSAPSSASIIFSDSLLQGKTPFTLHGILPGRYDIVYKRASHRDAKFVVEVQSQKLSVATYQLRDTSLWVDYYEHNSDLPSNSLSGITVDKNNVKWISTLDKGIITLNGSQYTVLNTSNSGLPSNRINCIVVDGNNKKWIGTEKGLAVVDGSSWTVYNTLNSVLPTNNVTSVEMTETNVIWIGTSNGIVRAGGSDWKVRNFIEPSGEPLTISDIQFQNDRYLWIGTTAYGMYYFNGKHFFDLINWDSAWFNKTDFEKTPTQNISSMSIDSKGNLWTAYNFDFVIIPISPGNTIARKTKLGGISFFNGISWLSDSFLNASEKANSVYIDNKNFVWFCTGKGLYKYSSINLKTPYTKLNSGLTNDDVTGIVKDADNVFWITTLGGGLNKYKGDR